MLPLGGRHLPPEEVEQHEDHQMRCLQFMWNSADYKCYANHNQSAVIMEHEPHDNTSDLQLYQSVIQTTCGISLNV